MGFDEIESELTEKCHFYIQCPNDVMPDPDFFGFFKFPPGPVTQTIKIFTLETSEVVLKPFWQALWRLGHPFGEQSGIRK